MENKYCYTKIIILGSGKLAFQCAMESLKYLENVQVLEYKVTDSTVLQKLCEKEGVPYRCCEKEELFRTLNQESESTLLVSASNTYLIPKPIIGKENYTIINWHNALLPRHKGRNAESWCIYEGDEVTGVTWHMLTADVDAGDIIIQKEIPIEANTTALKLFQKQCDLGVETFGEILGELLSGQCELQTQKPMEQEQMHYSYQIPNDGRLDTRWNFEQISCFLRAMDYGALQLLGEMQVQWQDKKYSFRKYRIAEASEEADDIWMQDKDMLIIRQGHKIVLRSLEEIC